MSSTHINGGEETPLNEGLDKLDEAYRQLGHEQPPDLLDQAILNRAHRAVEKGSHWMQFGWLHGLTTAAVIVLAFFIILNQRSPSPVYENGLIENDAIRVQQKTGAESRSLNSLDDVAEQPRPETNEETRERQKVLKSIPASAPTGGHDKDNASAGLREQKTRQDEADRMAGAPLAEAVAEQVGTTVAAEPLERELKTAAHIDSGAEEQLQTIIELKKAGNEDWRKQLELFIETHPDYPLPEILKD